MNLIQYEKQTKELSTILGIVIPMLDNRISIKPNIDAYRILRYQLTAAKEILFDPSIRYDQNTHIRVDITEKHGLDETDPVLSRALHKIRHIYNNSVSL